MDASPLLDGTPLSLEVANGVATLNGTVDGIRQRVAATRAAYEGGATFVDNRLRVVHLD
jgi:osmotically-inducible protein OsmY